MPTIEQIAEKIKPGDLKKIRKIVARAIKEYKQNANIDLDETDLAMDLVAVHGHCRKLDLDKLLKFDDFNFAHDISGIKACLDREKIELTKCFLPRCAR